MRHTSTTSRSVKLCDAVDDEGKLVARQILMHGQRDRRIGMTVRHREVPPFVSKVAQALLAVERIRVVHPARDGWRAAMRQHRVAPCNDRLRGHGALLDTGVA